MPLLYHTTQKAANLTEREVGAIAERLKGQIAGEVRMDRYDRLMYSTDASIYQMVPVGVVDEVVHRVGVGLVQPPGEQTDVQRVCGATLSSRPLPSDVSRPELSVGLTHL